MESWENLSQSQLIQFVNSIFESSIDLFSPTDMELINELISEIAKLIG